MILTLWNNPYAFNTIVVVLPCNPEFFGIADNEYFDDVLVGY